MQRLARLLLTLVFFVVAAIVAISILAPHLLTSLQDRSGRVLKDVPGIPDILKPKPAFKLSERLAEKGLVRGQPVFIRIMKESSELELWMAKGNGPTEQWVLLHTWPICRWSGTLGPKLKEGDGQSPEGFYVVNRKALNPQSAYYLSFNVGFPNAYDRSLGRTGSFLMVHGDCLSIGCYAMTDAGIEDIYGLVEAALKAGQANVAVHIFPFRMNNQNMAVHQSHPAMREWLNLKEGWDWFEVNNRPPTAQSCDKNYKFGDRPIEGCKPITGM
jgi:murein L,D-transpeptidase YafK